MDRTPTLFIVEDDEDDCELLQRAFDSGKIPCSLNFFANGLELIQRLESIADTDYPALILLDLNMPVLDGFETLQRLKTNDVFRAIPILVLTSSNYPKDVAQTYHLGSNAYLCKPNTFTSLVDVIDLTTQYWLHSSQIPANSGTRRLL